MLEVYSQRSKLVVFIARVKARKDGAHAIGLDLLLEGIIVALPGKHCSGKKKPRASIKKGGPSPNCQASAHTLRKCFADGWRFHQSWPIPRQFERISLH